jgi:hypothetical protein
MKGPLNNIRKTVKERIAEAGLNPSEEEIRKYILSGFARNGRPPAPSDIKKGLRLSSVHIVNQTIEKLERADILSKKGDEIVSAYPFSATATSHKVIFEDGHEVYALCATDALGIHFMLNKNITIISKCHECKNEIRIIVKNRSIDSWKPKKVVEFVGSMKKCGCTAEALCPFINFFCSMEHLKKWREQNLQNDTGEIYSLSEAMEHGRIIFENLLK